MPPAIARGRRAGDAATRMRPARTGSRPQRRRKSVSSTFSSPRYSKTAMPNVPRWSVASPSGRSPRAPGRLSLRGGPRQQARRSGGDLIPTISVGFPLWYHRRRVLPSRRTKTPPPPDRTSSPPRCGRCRRSRALVLSRARTLNRRLTPTRPRLLVGSSTPGFGPHGERAGDLHDMLPRGRGRPWAVECDLRMELRKDHAPYAARSGAVTNHPRWFHAQHPFSTTERWGRAIDHGRSRRRSRRARGDFSP